MVNIFVTRHHLKLETQLEGISELATFVTIMSKVTYPAASLDKESPNN